MRDGLTRRDVTRAIGGGVAASGVGYVTFVGGQASRQPPTGRWPQYQGGPRHTGHAEDTSGPTGPVAPRWEYDTGSVMTTPTVASGVVYVADMAGTLTALDADSGRQQWQADMEGGVEQSAPMVVDGTVYVGDAPRPQEDAGAGHLLAFDADDGSRLWTVETDYEVGTSPAVTDETVVVGIGEINGEEGSVAAVDANTGQRRWTFETGAVRSSPVVADGVVYVGDFDEGVHALSLDDGNELWRHDAFVSSSSPAVLDGTVYISCGPICALEATAEETSTATDTEGPTDGSSGGGSDGGVTSSDDTGGDRETGGGGLLGAVVGGLLGAAVGGLLWPLLLVVAAVLAVAYLLSRSADNE